MARKYDVYGAVIDSTGSSDSQHKFCGSLGHTSDDNTGLIYMRARYMDPAVGRFLSEDPAEDGVNWLVYCNNNPVSGVDASGECVETIAYDTMVVSYGFAALTAVLIIIAGYLVTQAIEMAKIHISFSRRNTEDREFGRACGDLGLTREEREQAHREISGQGITGEEMWETLRDIIARRDPCGRRGGRPRR